MWLDEVIERLIVDQPHVQAVIQHDMPMLMPAWGAKDEDALVHTLGINLLGSLGRASGYVGLVEYPVPRARQWQKKLVRVDSAWIDREARGPVLLAEFERFSMETILEKLTNLYVAAHGCDVPPEALLLCVWAMDGAMPNLSWFRPEQMLPVPGGPAVGCPAGCRFYLVQAVFGRQGEKLHFLRFRRLP